MGQQIAPLLTSLPLHLWVYTNYDCNLSCSYCVVRSSPTAERRSIDMPVFKRLIDEGAEVGASHVFLTGGEPFLLPDIFDRVAYCCERLSVTVLTNGMRLGRREIAALGRLGPHPLTLQVSLDGHRPDLHDAYRGTGSWAKTVTAIRRLVELGLRVTIGATETPVNAPCIAELVAFAGSLGISPSDVFVRPLTRRGFSEEGVELAATDLVPELTVTVDGVYWHPQTAGAAMLLSRSISPLGESLDLLDMTYRAMHADGALPVRYRCA